jgi:hypothetical protein
VGAFDFRAVMVRVAALQKEAMLNYPNEALEIEAFDYMFATHAPPYFTNRLGSIGVTSDSEELDAQGFDVQMRLYAGKITSGQSGEREIELQRWIGHIIQYFNERETLQSKEYSTGADNIDFARISACLGVVTFQSPNAETPEFGTEFTLRVTARNCIGLDYDGDGY